MCEFMLVARKNFEVSRVARSLSEQRVRKLISLKERALTGFAYSF